MRVRDDPVLVSSVYLALVAGVGLLVLPVFAGMAALADVIIVSLYGARWGAAGDVLRPLCLAMPFFVLWAMTTPLIWIRGQPLREMLVQLPIGVLVAIAVWGATSHSLSAVAWAVFGCALVRYAAVLRVALPGLGIKPVRVWRAGRGGVLLATVVFVALMGLDHALEGIGLSPPARLISGMLGGAVLLSGALRWFPRFRSGDLRILIEHLEPRLPMRLRRLVRACLSPGEKGDQ
jgi:O-antigen/teichoic acid export membrane protein